MATIYGDFNARTEDDRVRLDTRGALRSLAEVRPSHGEWVWLSDGEVRAPARIEIVAGLTLAVPEWNLVEEIIPPNAPHIEKREISESLEELKRLMEQYPRNHRRIWSLLSSVESAIPDPGRVDYIRSRAAMALGSPPAALLAIDDALSKQPDNPAFLYHRLNVLLGLDAERAFDESKRLVARRHHALFLCAYAQAQSQVVRKLGIGKTTEVDQELLQLTEGFSDSEGANAVPASARSLVHVSRGYALARSGKRGDAKIEFGKAIEAAPDNATAYAARGLETYPDPAGLQDLQRARELGFLGYWASYFLAHAAITAAAWEDVERLTNEVLKFSPPDRVAANTLEWRAIAAFNRRQPNEIVRRYFKHALTLAPNVARIPKNLASFENAIVTARRTSEWSIENDEPSTATHLAAA